MSREYHQKIPSCPACGASVAVPASRPDQEFLELSCSNCGGLLRVRRRRRKSHESPAADPRLIRGETAATVPGDLELKARLEALRALRWSYKLLTVAGASGLLLLGGFIPVMKTWLREDQAMDWTGLVATLGGVWPRPPSKDPDADYGPTLAPADAPGLFQQVGAVARELGVRPPRQLRVSYLPCCGVTSWGREQALVIGLPLLDILTQQELRAVLAHELAHLALGDTTSAARSVRFIESLAQDLQRQEPELKGPLGAWARYCHRVGSRLLSPVSRGQEIRADRAAASVAGGSAAASALVQVALVQSLFREVLDHYDATNQDQHNLYAFFRAFWARLPASMLQSLRHHLLSSKPRENDVATKNGPHPSLLDRLEVVQHYPDDLDSSQQSAIAPAIVLISDLEALEQMLHNRLFGLNEIQPSVFHRAGT